MLQQRPLGETSMSAGMFHFFLNKAATRILSRIYGSDRPQRLIGQRVSKDTEKGTNNSGTGNLPFGPTLAIARTYSLSRSG